MTDDKTTRRRMVMGFVLICLGCSVMHVLMVRNGNMYLERSEPRYNLEKPDTAGTMKEGVGVVEGQVAAVSTDKFFLTLKDGKMQTFLLDELDHPEVGSLISVTYAGGDPPKALMFKPKSYK